MQMAAIPIVTTFITECILWPCKIAPAIKTSRNWDMLSLRPATTIIVTVRASIVGQRCSRRHQAMEQS
jgi:hypothetical protein